MNGIIVPPPAAPLAALRAGSLSGGLHGAAIGLHAASLDIVLYDLDHVNGALIKHMSVELRLGAKGRL